MPTQEYPSLQRRKRGEISEIFDSLGALHTDPRVQHREKHGREPESVFIVVAAAKRGFSNYLSAREIVGGEGEIAYLRFESAKFEAAAGDLFSTDGVTLMFPDLENDRIDRFKVTEITAGQFEEVAGSHDSA
jgi:hypothetical protein